MSLDGFVAGPDQSFENPIGVGGQKLHEWLRELTVWRQLAGLEGGIENASTQVFERNKGKSGATIMGRNMFGGGPGPWEGDAWRGWWGENPPFHMPVFVLTHYARPPLQMEGGTCFYFVTEGVQAALELAKEAAGDKDISISGGASVAKQFLMAGLLDEITINLVPVLLGDGVQLFNIQSEASFGLEQVSSVEAPGVTHLTYRVVR